MHSVSFLSASKQFQPLIHATSNQALPAGLPDTFIQRTIQTPQFGSAKAKTQAQLNNELIKLISNPNTKIEIILEKLNEDANANACDNSGRPALHLAAGGTFKDPKQRLKIVEALLANGAKIDAKDKKGFTALMLAITPEPGSLSIVNALLAKGAKIEEKDNWVGQTALIFAAKHEHLNIVKALLAKGAKVDASDKFGNTALMMASIGSGSLKIVEALLAKGANLDHQDNEGHTALMMAVEWGNLKIVEALLGKGANTKLKDNRGRTASDLTSNKRIKALLAQH